MICTSLTIASLCKRLTPIVNDVQKAGNQKIKENMKFMALNNLCSQKNPYLCSILTEF